MPKKHYVKPYDTDGVKALLIVKKSIEGPKSLNKNIKKLKGTGSRACTKGNSQPKKRTDEASKAPGTVYSFSPPEHDYSSGLGDSKSLPAH